MKTAIFTTVLVLICTVNIFAAQPAFTTAANTTSDGRIAIELGVRIPINTTMTVLVLAGGTPFPKKSTDIYGMDWFDARLTLGVDLLVRPKRSVPFSLVLGVYTEQRFMVDRPADNWNYQHSLLLTNVGIEWQFHRNWATQVSYRPGITMPYGNTLAGYTPDQISIKLYGWVI